MRWFGRALHGLGRGGFNHDGFGRRRLGHHRFGRHGGDHALGHLGNPLDGDIVQIGDIVPAAIGPGGKNQRQGDERARRHAAFVVGFETVEVLAGVEFSRLGLEAPHQIIGVEIEIGGVAAQETDDIGRARQVGEAPLLDGQQMVGVNP